MLPLGLELASAVLGNSSSSDTTAYTDPGLLESGSKDQSHILASHITGASSATVAVAHNAEQDCQQGSEPCGRPMHIRCREQLQDTTMRS